MASMDEDGNEEMIKIILIGDVGVGKTNLINVSSGRGFNENEKSTLSASYSKKDVHINGQTYKISLWDTIGQEKLRNLSKLFFKNSKIVVFVFDITNRTSFNGLALWEQDVREMLGDDNIVKAIIGNKQDLYLEEQVSESEAIEYAKSHRVKFKLTSAKRDPEGFSLFLEELLKDYLNKQIQRERSIVITKENNNKKRAKSKSGCC
jgi:small GTP-binding protein